MFKMIVFSMTMMAKMREMNKCVDKTYRDSNI